MDTDATVTATDIARLAGVSRAAVSNWRRRHADFPQPVGGTATSPAFALGEIRDWLRVQGRLRDVPAEESVWQQLRSAAADAQLADVTAYAGAFLLYLQRNGDHWASLSAESDKDVAARLPGAVREAAAGLPGEHPFPARLGPDQVPVMRALADLAGERGIRETFEFLRERYLEVHTRRTYYTPAAVVRLMLDLVGGKPASVLDPACGSGSFLIEALRRSPDRVLGQDSDDAAARLTAIRLALRTERAKIRGGDSLRDDAFSGVQVEAVVCNPPFNDRSWGYEELSEDPRWEYGLPPRMESELAWVQHALAHLEPGGRAAILMPPVAGFRRSGRRIRAQLLRRGALRAVIALPAGSIPNISVALSVWVLQRPTEAQRSPGQVLMVDSSGISGDIGPTTVRTWQDFLNDPETEHDEPGVSRTVRIIDLLDEDVDLTPGRYLAPVSGTRPAKEVSRLRDQVLAQLAELAGLIPEAVPAPQPVEAALVPISELVRTGAVRLYQSPGIRADDASGDQTLLTARDVVEGRPPAGRTGADENTVVTAAGDVVVPTVTRTPVARVLTKGGAVLGPHLALLRPDPARIDPHFLAGILRSSLNRPNYSATTSSSYRMDVRRARVPVLSLGEQHQYGEAFRRLDAFESALRQATELSADLRRSMSDGLADGSLRLHLADEAE